jgi:hypothetical protein
MKSWPLLLLCVACSTPFPINLHHYASPHEDLATAWLDVATCHKYIPDGHAAPHYLKSPKEFDRDGGGMCGDFALDLLYLVGRGSLVLIDTPEGEHYIVSIDGQLLEPQIYTMYYASVDVLSVTPWNEAMLECTLGGIKGL